MKKAIPFFAFVLIMTAIFTTLLTYDYDHNVEHGKCDPPMRAVQAANGMLHMECRPASKANDD